MTSSFIQLPVDSTGKMLSADTWTQGANTVYGQSLVSYSPAGTADAHYTPADAQSVASMLATNDFPMAYNGSNWERLRTAGAADGGTGTGVLGVGLLGWDGSAVRRGSVQAGDSGQSLQIMGGGRKEVSFSTTTAQAVAATDCSNYRQATVQFTAQGTGSTVAFQGSNDNVNWFGLYAHAAATQTGAFSGTAINTTNLWTVYLTCRYFRLNVTGISAGTTSGIVEFFAVPVVEMAMVGGINQALLIPADAQGIAGSTQVWSQNAIFNGTTFDRLRSSPSADGTSGTGLMGSAVLAFDGANYRVIATGNSSTGAADGASGARLLANTLNVYNGSTFDRLRSAGSASNTTGTGLLGIGNLVYDGTNWQVQGGYAGDSGQNAAIVAGGRKEVSFSTTVPVATTTIDVSNYRFASVHITDQGTSSSISYQGSNDGVNWAPIYGRLQGVTSGSTGTATSVTGMIEVELPCRYFRLHITGISAGTTAGVIEFFTVPPAPNLVLVGGMNPSAVNPADAVASSQAAVMWSQAAAYNGTTWDRLRGGLGQGTQSTNYTGIQNVSLMAAHSSSGGFLVETASGATTGADANNGRGSLSTALVVFNGTNFDRQRSANAAGNTTGAGLLGVGELAYDGTNWQPMGGYAGDSGQNARIVAGGRKEVSFSTTTVQAVASTDCSNYRWVSVQVTGQGTSSTINFQASNDNANWVSINLLPLNGGSPVGSTTGIGIWQGPVSARYFRLNVTGISAGTTAGVIELLTIPMVQPQSWTVASGSGDATVGSATLPVGLWVYNGSTFDRLRAAGSSITSYTGVLAVQAMLQTGASAAQQQGSASFVVDAQSGDQIAASAPWVWNGTNWDRQRSATGAAATTGTGLLGAGVLGIYNSTPPSVTSGNYERVQLDSSANLKTNIAAQSTSLLTMQNAATVAGNGTTATVAGLNGAQIVEIAETAGGTATIALQGSMDNTNWISGIGYQQTDGVTGVSRQTANISVAANSRHVYQVLDPYPYLRAVLSNPLTSATVTARVYGVPA